MTRRSVPHSGEFAQRENGKLADRALWVRELGGDCSIYDQEFREMSTAEPMPRPNSTGAPAAGTAGEQGRRPGSGTASCGGSE